MRRPAITRPKLHRRIVTIAVGLLAACIAAHGAAKPADDVCKDSVETYVIAAANDGGPRRPEVTRWKGDKAVRARTHSMTEEKMKEYLDCMVRKIDTEAPRDDFGRRKVLIFTHGGMNKINSAILRAANLRSTFKHEAKYYPIFIAWNSAPVSCYGEHLFRVRQGTKRHWVYGGITSPFYFLGDLTRGLSRAPVLWARMIENGLTQPAGLLKNSPNAQRYIYAHEVALYQQSNKTLAPVITPNNVRESDWRGRESILPDVAHTVFFPTKAVGALILDTMGTGAWDIMLRRAQELFDSPIRRKDFADVAVNESPAPGDPVTDDDESDRRQIRRITALIQNRKTHVRVSAADRKEINRRMKKLLNPPAFPPRRKVDFHARSRAGAVEMLLRRLTEEEDAWKKAKKRHAKYSITVVGHSMGAIVSNEMLKRHPGLSFDRIIYLAAACSVKDVQDSVVPYLRQRVAAGNPARFYNLSLHRVAETHEAMGGDKGDVSLGGLGKTAAGLILVPRGSLLQWLDDFFTKPLNYEERRLGKWAAAITSVEVFPKDLRPFVNLKMFPVGLEDQHIPEEHGEFGDRHGEPQLFWKEPFLDPEKIYRAPLDNPEDTPAQIDQTALP